MAYKFVSNYNMTIKNFYIWYGNTFYKYVGFKYRICLSIIAFSAILTLYIAKLDFDSALDDLMQVIHGGSKVEMILCDLLKYGANVFLICLTMMILSSLLGYYLTAKYISCITSGQDGCVGPKNKSQKSDLP